MRHLIPTLLPLLAAAMPCFSIPIVQLPGYSGVATIERSDFSYPYIFAQVIGVDPRLQRLSGPLNLTNRDFGTDFEHYDIFFSDADGTYNALGEYVSIEATLNGSPGGNGGGLNIDAVFIGFNGGFEYASFVASMLPGSQGGYIAGSESRILGVEDRKVTTMGFTTADDRMRITVGFPTPSPTPEPGTWGLMGLALALGAAYAKRGRSERTDPRYRVSGRAPEAGHARPRRRRA